MEPKHFYSVSLFETKACVILGPVKRLLAQVLLYKILIF